MTEYELVKEYTEDEAITFGGVNESELPHIRKVGMMLTMRYGLTPERVWNLTKNMRKIVEVKI